jgi:hypothetical protein
MKTETPRTDAHQAACLKSGGRSGRFGQNAYWLARELERENAKLREQLEQAQIALEQIADYKGRFAEDDPQSVASDFLSDTNVRTQNTETIDTGDDSLCNVRRLRAEIRGLTEALEIANRSADEQMRYKREAEAKLQEFQETHNTIAMAIIRPVKDENKRLREIIAQCLDCAAILSNKN